MLSSSLAVVATAALSVATGFAAAQYSAPANATSVALLEAQWKNAGLDTPIQNGQYLGPIDPRGLLGVRYGETTVNTGSAYPAGDVAERPTRKHLPVMFLSARLSILGQNTVTIYPATGANFSTAARYTVALVDFSAIADPDNTAPGQGQEYRHYLANGVEVQQGDDGRYGLNGGEVITSYAGPGPLVGTGAHRYTWLVYQQPESFTAPANLSSAGVGPSYWNFKAYVAETDLGEPVAANFFTVENGAPYVPYVIILRVPG